MDDRGLDAEMSSRWKRLDKQRRREVMSSVKHGRPPEHPDDLPLVRWQLGRQRRAGWMNLVVSLLAACIFAFTPRADEETLRRLVAVLALLVAARQAQALYKLRSAEARL